MPFIFIVRFLFGLLSIAILAAAVYLLATWYRGETVIDGDVVGRLREDWRLWTGLGLLAWSFLGRWIAPLVLARSDTDDATRPERSHGQMVVGAGTARLYVERHGPADGPVILFTHGWGLDSTIWCYARRQLANRFRLITWDLPGLGRSELDGDLTLEVLARNLRQVLALAEGRPVVLVGHSIGGMMIQTLARDHPELFGREIAGVILLNTTYTNPLRTMILSRLMTALRKPVLEPVMHLAIWLQPLAWLGAWQSYLGGSAHAANRLGFGRCVTRSQLEHTTLLATRNPPGVLARGNLAMFRWDAQAALPRLTVPTLVLGGDVDIVTKLEASRHIADAAPGARLETMPGANHMGFLEWSELYNGAIADFVESLKDRKTVRAESAGQEPQTSVA